jgi:hypothetical protein
MLGTGGLTEPSQINLSVDLYFPSMTNYKRKDNESKPVKVDNQTDEHVKSTDDRKASQYRWDQHAQPKCQPVQLS